MRSGNNFIEAIDKAEEYLRASLNIERLYEKQKEVLRILLEKFLNEKKIKGVLQMPTGAGKTIIAIGLIIAL